MDRLTITVVGGGSLGLWQALTLARRGHRVTLREAAPQDSTGAASRFAGAMLAPYCESEAAEPIIQQLGLRGLELWRQTYPGITARGSLVVATDRDHGELRRFARVTDGHRNVNANEIAALEPALSGRFRHGLLFQQEAHMAPRPALEFLIGELSRSGCQLCFDDPVPDPIWMAAAAGDLVIDCRGMSACSELPGLRGVRGEMAVVHAPDVHLTRAIRLLHPRFPIYAVPWGNDHYMIGATVIERQDTGAVTLRSAIELLASACTIHSAFKDANIVELSAGVRPSFDDNVPKIVAHGRRLFVNGAFRHGFLLAPALSEIVADHLESGKPLPAELIGKV